MYMKKFIKFSFLAVVAAAILGTVSCAQKEADTDQLSGPVALAAVDQHGLEQRLAAVDDLESGFLPSGPGVALFLFGDSGGGLCCLDPLSVDGLGLLADPCPVQALGEAQALTLAVEPPGSQHDSSQIVLHGVYLLFDVLGSGEGLYRPTTFGAPAISRLTLILQSWLGWLLAVPAGRISQPEPLDRFPWDLLRLP